ncbi:uncharacterized protein LOC143240439 [Tachypleus tridentatus]|uniref:uncharacterized protein LOC143240439 n=1 Tax=Tachypleus tridentatus TaxID=6853 RepID=UPI003FD54F9A
MKTEQSDDLTQSEVISKFSKSTDDDLDSSKCGVINVKIETELQEDVQCVDSRLESTSDVKSSVNICCGSQFPENYVLKQDVHGKTNLNGNNIKQSVIPQDGDKPHSYITCGRESVTVYNLKEHKRTPTRENLYNSELNKQIHTGEKPYSCVVCGKHCRTNTELNIHQRIHLGEKLQLCRLWKRV